MWQTRIDPELLISLVENRPLIWDKTLDSYKDKSQRAAAWREVCIILNDDFEGLDEEERQNYAKNVVKKWNHIRDSWLRSLNAQKNPKKPGSAFVFVRKYRYYQQLLFLNKILEPAETSDSGKNTEISQDNTDDENDELENSINQSEEIEHDPFDGNESPKQENPTTGESRRQGNSTTGARRREENPTSSARRRQENPTSGAKRGQENHTSSAKRFKKSDVPRQQHNALGQNMMSRQNDSRNEECYLSFFKSLLPSVASLNDDQLLQFYAGVISLLQNIKSDNRNQWPDQQQSCNHPCQSSQGYFTPQYVQSSPSATSIPSSLHIDDIQSLQAVELVMKTERLD